MKKVIGVAAFAVLGMVALSSCKKEYACECVTAGDITNVVTENHKGKDAADACDSGSSVLQLKVCTPA